MINVKLNISGIGIIELELKKGKYMNGRLVIWLEEQTGVPWCKLTVNLPDDNLEDGEFFVKTWSENADTTTALIEQTDLFENTGRIVPTGSANACVWKFKNPKTLDQMRGY
jgi:hypothetical protein